MALPLTAVVQIGNSDDKLTQEEWSNFCRATHGVVYSRAFQHLIHFSGQAPGDAPWQNACWVFELHPAVIEDLQDGLALVARDYKQDSIALLVSETEFVAAAR